VLKKNIILIVNGDQYETTINPWHTLAEVLRNKLRLTGTKVGCSQGNCGACTVMVDNCTISSCITLAIECHNREIITIEGLTKNHQELDPLQQAFIDKGAVQCGFCSSGMIISAKYLLNKQPHPSKQEIRQGISGNLCRCSDYNKIIEAIKYTASLSLCKKS